jgi:DNA-binding NarL/FixJ family response regulator
MTDPITQVLLVEDDPGDTRLIRSLLAESSLVHFSWTHVNRLSDATQVLRSEPFDLVLLDLVLTDSQGLETFTSLYPHALCLPVVILTDVDDETLASQTLRAGAQDYLVKDRVDIEMLARALRHAVERKRAETELRIQNRELIQLTQQLWPTARLSGTHELLSSIGRDLENPLDMLRQHIESLLQKAAPDDPTRITLQFVKYETDRMGRLLSSLLEFNQTGGPETSRSEIQGVRPLAAQADQDAYFYQALGAWTAEHVLKAASVSELLAAIKLLAQEGMPAPLTLGSNLLSEYLGRLRRDASSGREQLSLREQEIVRLVAGGRPNKEIAALLSLSVRTVERHRSSIMNKLGLQNRAELVAYAVKKGILNGEDTK